MPTNRRIVSLLFIRRNNKQRGRKRRNLFRPVVETLEDRRLLTTFYADNPGDYVITIDQGDPGLDDGDTVTWDSSATHPDGPVTGLTFGTDAFGTIQDAIDAASASGGDTVNVAAGEYMEAGAPGNNGIEIDKPITLRGAGADEDPNNGTLYAPVSAGGQASNTAIRASADDVTIADIFVDPFKNLDTGTAQTYRGVIFSTGANTTVEDVSFHNFIREGIELNGADGSTVRNVTAFGVDADGTYTPTTVGQSGDQDVVRIVDSENVTVENLTANNVEHAIVAFQGPTSFTVNGLTVNDADIGIQALTQSFNFGGGAFVRFGGQQDLTFEGSTEFNNVTTAIKLNDVTNDDSGLTDSVTGQSGSANNAPDINLNVMAGSTFAFMNVDRPLERQNEGSVPNLNSIALNDIGLNAFATALEPGDAPDGRWYYETFNGAVTAATPASGAVFDLVNQWWHVEPPLTIQEAVDTATDGDVINVTTGTYTEDVDVNKAVTLQGEPTIDGTLDASVAGATLNAGFSPGTIASGDLTLSGGSVLDVEIDGLTPGAQHDQYVVTGAVSLGGATLNATGTISGAGLGDTIVFVDNDGSDDVNGQFAGLDGGDVVTVNGAPYRIFYDGGDGNDVVLVRAGSDPSGCADPVHVDDDWAGTTPGADPDGGGPATAFGVDAFATIQDGVDHVCDGGTVNVRAGTYGENVVIEKGVALLGAQAGVDATANPGGRGAESLITPDSAFGVEVRADDVTIDGFEISQTERDAINVRPTNSAPGIATRDNVVIRNNHIHVDEVDQNLANGIVFGETILPPPNDSTDDATISNVTVAANFIDVSDSGNARGIAMTGQFNSILFDGFDISGNTIQAKSTGLFISETTALYTANGIEILGNRFEEPGSLAINGGNFDSASKVNGNTFINNSSGAAVNFREAGGQVMNNTFENHTNVGLFFFDDTFFPQSSEDATVTGNTFTNNLRHMDAPAPAVDVDAIQNNNTFDQGARASSVPELSGTIARALDEATAGDTVTVFIDTAYQENVDVNKAVTLLGDFTVDGTLDASVSGATLNAGLSPGTIASGDLTLSGGSVLDVEIDGLTPGAQHDQYVVTGAVNLGGATLNATGTISGAGLGDTIVFVDNDGSDDVNGQFAGLDGGDVVTVNGAPYRIFYDGGDGNDVVLVRAGSDPSGCADPVHVDDDWAGTTPGADPDGGGPATAFGVDAFATVQDGIDHVCDGGTVNVAAGTYAGLNAIDKSVTLHGANAGVHPAVGVNTTETVGTRGPESIISHNGLFAFRPETDDITIDGFRFEGSGGRVIDSVSTDDNDRLHLTNNIFANTNTGSTQGVIQIVGGSNSGMEFDFNLFQHTGDSSAVHLGGAVGGGANFDGLRIANNLFNQEGSALFQGTDIPLAGAVIEQNEFDGTVSGVHGTGAGINAGKGGNISVRDNYLHDLFFTGFQIGIVDGEVLRNRFEQIHVFPGFFGQAFELWGGQFTTTVSDNVMIANNIVHFNDVAGAADPTHGLRLRAPDAVGIDASTITVFNNTFVDGGVRSDAFATRHLGDQTTDLNASENFWSTTVEADVVALTEGPTDVTPYLDSGADTDSGTVGFQGDFSTLNVTSLGEQTGAAGRIQEGVDDVDSGGTVNVLAGTYAGDVDAGSNSATIAPGSSPGLVTMNGNLTLDSNDTLAIEIDGTAGAGVDPDGHDQVVVTGDVDVTGATLDTSGSGVGSVTPGTSLTIIDNQGGNPVTGTFSGLAEGGTVTVDGVDFQISYLGGTGNDVALTRIGPATTFVVDIAEDESDGDHSPGDLSLREAIELANANVDFTDTIAFDIPGDGPHTIQPLSPLPTVTDAVVIDGSSEPDYAGSPIVEIDGSLAGTNGVGLRVVAAGGGSTIRGLAINRFDAHGIVLSGSGSNTIEGNFIGTDTTGTIARGNRLYGVSIVNSANNQIGGAASGAGNVLSDNRIGLVITGAGSMGNVVEGNLIGTDASGTADLGNRSEGLLLTGGSSSNTVGGTVNGAGNVISGNDRNGVAFSAGTTGNVLLGNLIGTDAAGTGPLGNTLSGVFLVGVTGNTVGGAMDGAGNVIAGNGMSGVMLNKGANNNSVQGNLIGTDVAGTAALGNAFHGVAIQQSPSNQIGGTAAAAGNVISGNLRYGVLINGADSTGNRVEGNQVGTDSTGMAALGNLIQGVAIDGGASGNSIGGPAAGAGNVISGNVKNGVIISAADANTVQGNLIGTDATGSGPLGNMRSGIFITGADDNEIGGQATGAGNMIGHNGVRGVVVTGGGTGNAVLGNSIFDNANLGIDLDNNGATANDPGDPDAGANNLQNFPGILGVGPQQNDLVMVYRVNSAAANAAYPLTVEFFIADASGAEGMTLLGSDTYTTPNTSRVVSIPKGATMGGDRIVATATDSAGNTSEFSNPFVVPGPLLAAGGERSPESRVESQQLSTGDLQPIVNAAIDRLAAVGFAAELFDNVEVAVADLPGAQLGLAGGNTITLDVNAAGHGWDLGLETRDKSQEPGSNDSGSGLSTLDSRLGIDLLTVVMHELGHTAGLPDLFDSDHEDDLMYAWLEPGLRKMSLSSIPLVDEAFERY